MSAAHPDLHLLAKRIEMIAALPATGAIIRVDGNDLVALHDLIVQHRGPKVANATMFTNVPGGHPLGPDSAGRPAFVDPALAAAMARRVNAALAGGLRSVGVPPSNTATPRQAGPWHRPQIIEQPPALTIELIYIPQYDFPFVLRGSVGSTVYREQYRSQAAADAALPDFARRVRNGLGVPGSAVGGR